MSERKVAGQWFNRVALILSSPLVAGPLVLVMLVMAGVLAYRESRLDDVPDIGHPFDLEAVGTIDVDPADNALADYEAAARLLNRVAEPKSKDVDAVLDGTWEERTPGVERWLRDNESALNRWRKGTERDFYLRVQLKDLTIESHSISASDLIAIRQLCGLKAAESESHGDLEGAWAWHRALFRYSRHVGVFGTAIDRSMGAAAHGTAVDLIVRWAGNDDMTASQLARALSDVRNDYEMTPPRSVMVQADYFVTMDELNRLDELADWYREVFDSFSITGKRFPTDVELLLTNEPELTKRLLRHQVANLLAFVDQPHGRRPALLSCEVAYYAKSPSATDRFIEPALFQEAVKRSALAQFLLMKQSGAGSFTIQEEARQRVLETVLAAEQYRRERGAFPKTISALVDAGLMSAVPSDLTSPTFDPLGFERDPHDLQRAKVWTVGLNRVDDGGVFEFVDGPGPADFGYSIGVRLSEDPATPALSE